MSLVINHNLMASNAARNLNTHYSSLSDSTRRLSSGLRVFSASDDAAGLAIRELQRADIKTLQQGVRNANDAISLIQTADGALGIIDEKLIRMKELSEQAATGTYDSTQRLMINSEFLAMAAEIDRIANSTDFNGIHLLNGNLQGTHDGSGLTSTGAAKIHFGTGNDSAEDYYYIEIDDSTTKGLGLFDAVIVEPIHEWRTINTTNYNLWLSNLGSNNPIASALGMTGPTVITNIAPPNSYGTNYHIYSDITALGTLTTQRPTTNIIQYQVFAPDGTHIAGTTPGNANSLWAQFGVNNATDLQSWMNSSGLFSGATYNQSASFSIPSSGMTGFPIKYEYTGSCNALYFNTAPLDSSGNPVASNNLIIVALVDPVPQSVQRRIDVDGSTTIYVPDVATQDLAQNMLERIDSAIVKKDKTRAHLGALQNRLENTISNLNIQAENLQMSESRISDVDVATEMTEFTRNQILTQSAVAMLAQANSLPKMAMQIIGG